MSVEIFQDLIGEIIDLFKRRVKDDERIEDDALISKSSLQVFDGLGELHLVVTKASQVTDALRINKRHILFAVHQ